MILGHDCGVAGFRSLFQHFDMIESTRRDRRAGVDVRIDGPYQQGIDAFLDLGIS